jgi:hypothetical protein
MAAGCDSPHAAADAQAVTRLLGDWSTRDADSGTPTETRVRFEPKQRFQMQLATPGTPQAERRTGTWMVTAGQLKLKYETIDDKPIGGGRLTYFTCRIEHLDERELRCADDIRNRRFTWQRATDRTPPAPQPS